MKYVVLGASAAGINGAKTLRKLDSTAEIILISKDEKVYSRCILHHYMEGIRSVDNLDFTEENFFETFRIQWKKGVEVTEVDPNNKLVRLNHGESVSFDKLLIATGASTRIPPIENLDTAKGVVGFRNLEDCMEILEQAKTSKHVVVLGAGLVGIDAVSGLLHKHDHITLVEFKSHMLSLQLDEISAKTYQDKFAEQGVKQLYNTGASQVVLDENNRIKELVLTTGKSIPCDLLILATSVSSNVKFLENSGIACTKFGLEIDAKGKTNHPDIFGAGDVTGTSPIWPTAVKEGIVAANNMVGNEQEMTDFFSSKCTMNFLSVPTMSLGMVDPTEDSYQVEIEQSEHSYKKIIHRNGKIYGAILQGDLSYSGILTQLIKENIDISQVEKPIFNIDYSDFFQLDQQCEFSFHKEIV